MEQRQSRTAIAARFLFAILAGASIRGLQAQQCHFAGEKNQDSTENTLKQMPSCASANAYLKRCAWGSSADAQFASIVIGKCEASFLPLLPPSAKSRYKQEQLLCGYSITPDGGTIQLSEAALCSATVAADFAKDPIASRKLKPLQASFDCKNAKSPLEIATCTNAELGNADIAMSRTYKVAERNLPPSKRSAFIQEQKDWQSTVVSRCNFARIPATAQATSCAVDQYKLRIDALNSDLDNPDSGLTSKN